MAVEAQPEQEAFMQSVTPEIAASLVASGLCRTVTDDAGNVLMCCGVIPFHSQRVHAWTLLSVRASRHMPSLVKTVKGFMDELPHRRIEMTIRVGFDMGVKWARILGFTPEAIMRAYLENGDDCILYARIRA